jgi:hypothetical protein
VERRAGCAAGKWEVRKLGRGERKVENRTETEMRRRRRGE